MLLLKPRGFIVLFCHVLSFFFGLIVTVLHFGGWVETRGGEILLNQRVAC